MELVQLIQLVNLFFHTSSKVRFTAVCSFSRFLPASVWSTSIRFLKNILFYLLVLLNQLLLMQSTLTYQTLLDLFSFIPHL